MQRIIHDNAVITYTFDTFNALGTPGGLTSPPVRAHVSTRHGGVSPQPWNTLNFSVLRGDTPERVAQNRQRLATALDIDINTIVRCKQVHGTGVAKVSCDEAGQLLDASDALITDTVGLPLQLVFADCTPILLYDRVHHALGVCHAGWRGTVNGAAAATLWAMQASYDTQSSDVLACIGPSIGPASYEVGDDVASFVYAKLNHPDSLFTFPNGPNQRPYFDLWKANAQQLIEAGVPAAQIEISAIDTAQNTADFFSHRAEKGRCGLFTLTAWLESNRPEAIVHT